MAALSWDGTGQRFFETGVDHGVLYTQTAGVYDDGFAWNGLVSVTESPSGAEASPQYADNIKYLNLISAEEFAATLEAFTYPAEFEPFDGLGVPTDGMTVGQQTRGTFGLSYRTKVGSDTDGNLDFKIHCVYGCQAAPSEKAYSTVNDSPEAVTFSWEITTTPVEVDSSGEINGVPYAPTSIVTFDLRQLSANAVTALENELYDASGAGTPAMGTPAELYALAVTP